AWRAVREGLQQGPVLVQVPRRGYVMGLSCERCRTRIRCPRCQGPTEVSEHEGSARCRWCGSGVADLPCPECGSLERRAGTAGEQRTAYEIGRAFPQVPVMTSRGGQALEAVDERPAVVVATPGAEPVAAAGYGAVLLLDGWALLGRAGLDAPVETLRRWTAAAALARPAGAGGRVVLCGVPAHAGLRPVEALLRWDPQWLVEAELAERQEVWLPPVSRAAVVSGPAIAVREVADHLREHDHIDATLVAVAGPVSEGGDDSRLVLRTQPTAASPAAAETELRRLVRAERARRSATKAPQRLSIRLDPADLGA
ncbi:MAG: primosome assembly protein PriA, partial [Ornithinimicrobium sp.]